MNQAAPPKLLSIGAMSRETGIHVSTIRMWEARYGALRPVRTEGGARRYSGTDLERLRVIKLLVDRGHKPSTIAALNLEQLNAELFKPSTRSSNTGVTAPRIASIGSTTWRSLLFTDAAMQAWKPAIHFDDLSEVESRLAAFDVGIVQIGRAHV
mgnify:FL=1